MKPVNTWLANAINLCASAVIRVRTKDFILNTEHTLTNLTQQVIGCSYKVANQLGVGFLEKVYENALVYELAREGLKFKQQFPIAVFYCGIEVGAYVADLLVEDQVIVELKAIKALDSKHFAQCMNYLKATGKEVGLLINFGSPKVEIRRVICSQPTPSRTQIKAD